MLAKTQRRHPDHPHRRAGLAPLELVLSLPLMLCVMALMINFGNAATWKIRASTSARLAVWRARPLWAAGSDPKPSNWWPASATMNVFSASRIPEVDTVWNQPNIAQAWIKGPVFSSGGGYLMVRDKRVNEMSEGISNGDSRLAINYPFMPALGMMSLRADHNLPQTLWQYHTMGYGLNTSRRAKGWWNIEDSADWSAEKRRYLTADETMKTNPLREYLRPLDREPELFPSRWGTYPFDFYPRAPIICIDDPSFVKLQLTLPGGLYDQIRGTNGQPGVSRKMASTYLKRYIRELLYWEPPPPSPPPMEIPPPGRVADLKLWISQLKDFLEGLG
jgi:hypothetical protein